MSNKPISPLRQRMIDDMRARRFSEDTQRDYVRNVRNFAAFLGQSPDTATKEDLRRFQLHLAQQQISQGRSTPPSPRCGSSSPRRSNGPTSFVP
jgi:integrase/recombinase XerD